MDAYKPFLGQIVRLDVTHQPAFHIAGVQHYKLEKVKNDLKSELESKRSKQEHMRIEEANEEEDEKKGNQEEHKGENLDTWA
ncbi:hypothetical protein ACSLBF_20155 (plasmid) [Pseudoalteromonas sp. T1lg65]|uniref:hypothetical protein n=1 Tax=Pseudoalteromonas sp. T1lg65 TaxID=2077101 RepID=UPI003F799BD6